MIYLKKIGTALIYFYGIIIIGSLIITLLNYFNLINSNFVSILEMFLSIIGMIISGFIIGKNSKNKGFIEGLKLGLITILMFIILNLILNNTFEFKSLIYYFILLFSSIIGSIIGINRNIKNN